jgi:hypothetical protein
MKCWQKGDKIILKFTYKKKYIPFYLVDVIQVSVLNIRENALAYWRVVR